MLAAQNQAWDVGFNVSVRKSTGATFGLGITERDAGGASLGGGSATIAISQVRKPVKFSRVMASASVAFAQPSLFIAYTDGVAVDAQIIIDTPFLQLLGGAAESIINEDPAATVNLTRWRLDTSSVQSGTKSLLIEAAGADSLEFSRDIAIKGGRGLIVRGWISMASRSAGAADIFVRWLNSAGAEISRWPLGRALRSET
jgi:hypothetical protein